MSEEGVGGLSDFANWASDQLKQMSTGINIHRPSPNQSFYKYISLGTKTSWSLLERTLNDCTLTGSTVHSLNDPFEGRACTFDDLHTLGPSWLPRTGFSATSAADARPTADEVARWRSEAHEYLRSLSERQRIVSFCERSDSPLLWSHYANSYRGACLQFLGRAFSPYSSRIGYVRYSNTRPDYPLRLAHELSRRGHDASLVSESDKILFFTKALDWAYEAEIRLIYDANRKEGNRFQHTGLVSIILGPSMDEESKARVRDMIRESKCAHLQVRQARLSRNAFSIEIAHHSNGE